MKELTDNDNIYIMDALRTDALANSSGPSTDEIAIN